MGAWGSGTFDNDDACDLACDLRDCTDLAVLEEALREAVDEDADVEAPEASRALAAAEVLLALLGEPTTAVGEDDELLAWVKACKQVPSPALLSLAQQAVKRVQAEDCELRELWAESDELEAWLAAVQALQARLAAAVGRAGGTA